MVIQARPIKIVVVLAVVSAQLALCSYSDAHNMGVHPLRHAIKRNWRHHPLRRASLAHTAIIGGTAAEEGTFPSLAHIQDFRGEEVGDCTGTVVAPNLILTAGHCAENVETGIVNEPSGYIVITGNVDWMAPEHQVSAVSRVIVYPGFVRSVLDRDAALLVLSAPTIAPAIPLAAWPSDSSKLQPGTAALLAGWGKTYYEQEVPTERLQWAETAVQGPGWCEKNASSFYAASELCTIDPPNYTTGTCEGDSGGPLIANAPSGGIIEIGIISTGYEGCSTTRPDVFTRADLISSWVHEWTEALKPPPPPVPAPAPVVVQKPSPPPSPPNNPGLYVTPKSSTDKIAVRVSGDGKHLVLMQIKADVQCRHGYWYALSDSWLSYSDNVPIERQEIRMTLETPSDRYMKRGSVGVYMYFKPGLVEGRLHVRIPSRNRRAGLCYASAIRFTARNPG